MPRRPAGAVFSLCLLWLSGCAGEPFRGPLRLLERATESGALPRVGALTSGGEARPALLESARWRVRLPDRPLLTFGIATSYAGSDEAPGWYQLAVRAGGRVLDERRLNPRALRGFRGVSLPLEDLRSETTLEFDLRLTDRDGRPIPRPPDLLLGVSEPTVHDLDAYGSAKGVVLISIDTLRRDHVGAYGYAKPTTPRFDALAREGVLCEDAVSTSSWTLPAHLSMLTSADASAHGGTDLKHAYNRKVPTLPATLKRAGFATQAVTSHLYVSSVYGLDEGFDHLDFQQDRKAVDVADRAIELLDRLGDRPFFVFLHLYDPHWHYDPPEAQRKLFEKPYAGKLTGLWQDFKDRTRANTSPADLEHLLALYDGEIRYADDQVGRILDHIKARRLDRGTLVVITSDHGEEFLEHGGWEHQKTLYEEVIRIPLAFRGPGITPRREGGQTSLLDVAPTVLAWAGLPPGPQQGRSLLAAVGDSEAYGETDHTADGTRKIFLRGGQGRWKAIFSLDRAKGEVRKEEWYYLAADPGETKDAPPGAANAAALRNKALARFKDGSSRGRGAPTVELTAEQRERLRALGYVR
jgi:arylsulfatase A-like enzyme